MSNCRPFARIVVGYDDSPLADTALLQSIAIAEQYGGDIVVVQVSDISTAAVLPIPTRATAGEIDPTPVLRSLDSDRRLLFEKLSARVATCAVPVAVEFAMNAAADGILDAAIRWNAAAIAVGTHARSGVARAVVGSVADAVLRGADIPVMVTRTGPVRGCVRRVIVGVDASEPAASASTFAVALGVERNVRLCFCTVTDTVSVMQPYADVAFDPAPLLSELRRSARDALDMALQNANAVEVFPDTEVIEAADAGKALCDAARRQAADAIVVGSHKRSNLERLFFGSTAEAVVRHADRPVIVVPARAPIGAEPHTQRSSAVSVRTEPQTTNATRFS
jgi:nucleotide-binding universal stress UspA family protein